LGAGAPHSLQKGVPSGTPQVLQIVVVMFDPKQNGPAKTKQPDP
jgi:hypothetical protein